MSDNKDTKVLLEKLTPEQEAMLPEIAKQCLAWGLSTEPLDKEKCIQAAKMCFQLAKEEVPPDENFFFVKSPFEGMKLANKILGNTKDEYVTPFYGSQEMGGLSYFIAFDQLGLSEVVKDLYGLIELAKNAGWTWFMGADKPGEKPCCIISERPVKISRDERGNAHCEDGMAIEYSDGWGVFAIGGVRVNEKTVMHPESLTPDEIDNETNQEVRRLMMVRLGTENYMKKADAKVISEDRFGRLLERRGKNHTIKVVEVVNATPEPDGSSKLYYLRVPPETETAEAGVAWTYGFELGEYNPSVET